MQWNCDHNWRNSKLEYQLHSYEYWRPFLYDHPDFDVPQHTQSKGKKTWPHLHKTCKSKLHLLLIHLVDTGQPGLVSNFQKIEGAPCPVKNDNQIQCNIQHPVFKRDTQVWLYLWNIRILISFALDFLVIKVVLFFIF